jgi:hypothetical protein
MKKASVTLTVVLCLVSCRLYAEGANQERRRYSSFRPGEVWCDTEGNRVQAHGGGMFYEDGTYYWFGEHGTPGRTKVGVP